MMRAQRNGGCGRDAAATHLAERRQRLQHALGADVKLDAVELQPKKIGAETKGKIADAVKGLNRPDKK